MKKYKNVKAVKAHKCPAYERRLDSDCFLQVYCLGVPEPFKNPTCKGYKCKCTEYRYNRKKVN